MYKAVIFDLDGTLLNTLEDLANACNYALSKCGFPIHQLEKYKKFVGDGRYKLIGRSIPQESRKPEVIDKVLELFNEYYEAHMIDMTKPYEGIIELLDILNEKGLKLGVVTNKPHEFSIGMVKNFFGDRIKMVLGNRADFPTKPNPEAVFEVLRTFNLSKEESIFIGDSNVDIKTAKNAKVKSVGVTWGFRGENELKAEGADFIVSTIDELKEILINI